MLSTLAERFGSRPPAEADVGAESSEVTVTDLPFSLPVSGHVVVIARHGRDDIGSAVLGRLDRGRTTVFAGRSRPAWRLEDHRTHFVAVKSLASVTWQLKCLGPVDAILDLSDDPSIPHFSMWRKIFLHLRRGGQYIIRHPESMPAELDDLRRHLLEAMIADNPGDSLEGAVDAVQFASGWTIISKRGDHQLRLRDREVDRVLPTRDDQATARMIDRLPNGVLDIRSTVRSHQSDVEIKGLDTQLEYPDLTLRHYTGRLAWSTHSLVYSAGSILPESFSHHLEPTLRNSRLLNVDTQFSVVPPELRPTQSLQGNYYFIDSPFPGHFGHITTEALSRLWGWDRAKAELPDLKAVFRTRFPNERIPGLELDLYRAYGITEDDIVWVEQPTWLESLVGVTPMWHNAAPHYVHPAMQQVWQRISDRLVADSEPTGTGERIFVSRKSDLARSCRNTRDLEALFDRYGFTIVYPEDHSLRQQARIFAEAKVVAGLAGSAMFNVFNCQQLEHLIVLAHEAYTARNEHLFAALLGGQVDYFWSRPDISHPAGSWTTEAFRSPWEFDFDRNQDELEELLKQL